MLKEDHSEAYICPQEVSVSLVGNEKEEVDKSPFLFEIQVRSKAISIWLYKMKQELPTYIAESKAQFIAAVTVHRSMLNNF